ncbi:FmdB family zinc ribbon protein, partial [Nocardiopsis sp. NPDC055824]
MPRYDFRCRECGDTFELSRPMAEAGDPAPCPVGHGDTVRLLSTVAVGGRASAPAPSGGGGCCGGGCCSCCLLYT